MIAPGAALADRGGVLIQELGTLNLAYRRSEIASQPVRLAPRPQFLAGREELLAELDARRSASDAPRLRTVVLCGLGGAGKTSVAVEYAYRHLAGVGVAWQLACEDPAVLAAGFGELAAQLGVRDLGDTRDPVASVHAALGAYPREWLLVFDNAPDLASIAAFLPPAGTGYVLITSRSALWPPGQTVDVPVLDIEVAARFLVSRTGDPDQLSAMELAGELGGLPLALEQAAAYLQASGSNLAGYLALFRQRRDAVLARGEPAGYGQTVATTWSLAFRQLEQSVPSAVSLLRLLACCAPEAVPLPLLRSGSGLTEEVAAALGPLLDDPLTAGDAIGALRRYSLVIPAGKGQVLVHRLVQAVTIDQMTGALATAWRQAAAALIEAAIPADTDPPEAWPACEALLPHAQAALAAGSDGMARIANYVGHSGSYAAARDLWRRIADVRGQSLSPEHPDRLAARQQVAYWTGEAGDPAGARDQYTALLPIFERILGPEHPDTLAIRASVARCTGEAGDPATARDQWAALLPVIDRVLGPEHWDTLTAQGNLAWWSGDAGDPATARDLFAALLPVTERVLGPEHPDSVGTRHTLAYWTGKAGDPATARDLFAVLLPIRERVMGAGHPDTLDTRHGLAQSTGDAGDPAGARDQYAALLPIRERVSGLRHPASLVVRNNLAYWTGEAGDGAGARDQYAALLPEMERALGASHPDTLAARRGLAAWTGASDPAGARDQYAALLPEAERVLGPEHPDTLDVRGNLAHWTGQAGDAAGARDQYAALLPVWERVLGAEHPETLITRRGLAHWTGQASADEPA